MFLLTGLITSLHFLSIYPLFLLFGIFLLNTAKPNLSSNTDKLVFAYWEALFLNLIIWLGAFEVKWVVNIAHEVFKAGRYKKCRNNILIGLSFIAIFSVFADELPKMSDNEVNLLNLLVPVSLIFAVYFFFVFDSSIQCKWKSKITSFQVVFCTIFLVAFRFFLTNFSAVQNYKNTGFLQISFFFVLVSSTLEIYAILMEKLVLLSNEEVPLESVVVVPWAPVKKDAGTQCEDVFGEEDAASECDEDQESVSQSEDDDQEITSDSDERTDSRSTIYIDFEIECEPRDDHLEEHVICLECADIPEWYLYY